MMTSSNTSKSSAKSGKKSPEDYNKVLVEGSNFLAQSGANMIEAIVTEQVEQVRKRTKGKLPEEFEVNIFDFESRLAAYCGFLRNKDGSSFDWSAKKFHAPKKNRYYDNSALPFTSTRDSGKIGYSWKTMYRRRFPQKKVVKDVNDKDKTVTTYTQQRFREANVNPYLAQSIKKLLNPVGIKVIDISDRKKSFQTVYKATAFPLEDNYIQAHVNQNVLNNDEFPALSDSDTSPVFKTPVKDSTGPTWAQLVQAPSKEADTTSVSESEKDEVKSDLSEKFEEVSEC